MSHHQSHHPGRTVSHLRRKAGLTQHQLATKLGVPYSRISYFETGRMELPVQEIDEIRHFLKKQCRKNLEAF